MRSIAVALFFVCTATSLFASNPIQIENARPGNRDWTTGGNEAANGEIEGYTSPASVNRGESVRIYVNTPEPSYILQVFRMGWYGGAGARRVFGPVTLPGTAQPMPTPQPGTGLIECQWTSPYVLGIPATDDWPSGVYLVKLTAPVAAKHKFAIFVVRDDARFSNHNFQLSVTTYQAYNNWGGKSLYTFNSSGGVAARKVSFDRPYITGSGTGDFLYRWEYNMLRFLEREGYDVTYSTNVDTHARPAQMLNRQDWLSIGHDEYWSWEMFDHVQAARDAGIDLGFFSANSAYWQIRFEPSSSGDPYRTIVSYKEKAMQEDPYALDADPTNDHLITEQFRDQPVNRPESQLLGVQYIYNPVTNGDMIIDDVTTQPWVFEGTGLVNGSRLPMLLGYEVDHMTQFSPPNTVRLGHSPYNDVNSGTVEYSDMTIYDAPSGAHVFATGTIQWAWGLDTWNEGANKVNPAAQQMTRNILRRFAGVDAERDCFALITPAAATVSQNGGSGEIAVQTQSYCAWNAVSNAPWITLTTIANNRVTYAYVANDGPARTGTITIGESTFTLTQASGCTYSIAPNYQQFSASGGGGSFTVTTGGGCPWTAVPNVPWITVTSATSGSGATAINYSIAPNSGPLRSGRIQVGSNYLTIDQSNGCTYTVTPTAVSVGASGGERSATVVPSSELCFWSASTSATWVTITSGTSGRGTGTVAFTIASSSGSARTGSVTAAGKKITVTQTSECTLQVSTTPQTFTRSAGSGTIPVSSCSAWSATTNVPWITLTTANGTNNGSVGFNVAANPSSLSRTGTITVSGQAVTITQYGKHIRGDFDGDGWGDLVWRHTDGRNRIWRMQGTALLESIALPSEPDAAWYIAGTGDFNADGLQDIVWRNTSTGDNRIWAMRGPVYSSTIPLPRVPDTAWKLYTVFDYEGDGSYDMAWRHGVNGSHVLWRMNQSTLVSTTTLTSVPSLSWTPRAAGDVNHDGWHDLIWHNVVDGRVAVWFMGGNVMMSTTNLPNVTDPNMELSAMYDVDRNGYPDIVWRNNATGANTVWLIPGGVYRGSNTLPAEPDTGWRIVGAR
ncbi:MAG TPA: N,N-dimethylformamidase beta subunit family domain-containing protein, partial [Thermoanaerobaculia bacterium]